MHGFELQLYLIQISRAESVIQILFISSYPPSFTLFWFFPFHPSLHGPYTPPPNPSPHLPPWGVGGDLTPCRLACYRRRPGLVTTKCAPVWDLLCSRRTWDFSSMRSSDSSSSPSRKLSTPSTSSDPPSLRGRCKGFLVLSETDDR